MSKALDYLLAARPEAMEAYFAFLKEAGSSLDPKTRDLISVITKVANQTERGFKQYLRRALNDGCTPNEVLDALLMAFPVLGLTKLVWAVDILLEMDLPGFDPEALRAARPVPETAWHDVCAEAAVPRDRPIRLEADGRGLFLYRTADEIRVYDSLCPHQVTNIPELAIDGTRLECPKHQWAFDLTSGACIDKGDQPLRRFDARIEDGRLLALW